LRFSSSYGGDIDVIYYCELVKLCPIVDCTGEQAFASLGFAHASCVLLTAGQCLEVTQYTISPKSAPLGSTFNGEALFQVYNQTGTGMLGSELGFCSAHQALSRRDRLRHD
jgi:hypothetical protein